MVTISELQKKRALNIVWNSAGRYDFQPDFKAYDSDGNADLYWNCIIGAARKHYDYNLFIPLFRAFAQYEEADEYEGLFWLGLENCVFQKELDKRPALAALRERYARAAVKTFSGQDDYHLYEALALAHFMRVLGETPKLNGYDEKLLSELEFTPDMTTEEIVARVSELFTRWFQISTQERRRAKRRLITPALKKRGKRQGSSAYKKFGVGIFEHHENAYGGSSTQQGDKELKTKMTDAELRAFMTTKYGKSAFSARKSFALEKALCSGRHAMCHVHFTRGERPALSDIQNGFEALSRQREAAQIEKNRTAYTARGAQNHLAVTKLAAKIQNSVLLHLQPAPVKANTGRLNSLLAWRAAALSDDRVFIKNEQDDMGELSVDILLDASTSQKSRQETVSAQGYIIAESLTRCGIPCRVMSFCSMTGYTILRIFREYDKPQDNRRIFEYVSNGCNRDGLAVAAAHMLMNESRCEHKMLIILSDVKPNDVIKIPSADGGEATAYEKDAGIRDCALEVRRARADGISVVCVFTGEDEDIPAAKLIYGRDFARIQSLEHMADTVGKLIQTQIKNL